MKQKLRRQISSQIFTLIGKRECHWLTINIFFSISGSKNFRQNSWNCVLSDNVIWRKCDLKLCLDIWKKKKILESFKSLISWKNIPMAFSDRLFLSLSCFVQNWKLFEKGWVELKGEWKHWTSAHVGTSSCACVWVRGSKEVCVGVCVWVCERVCVRMYVCAGGEQERESQMFTENSF